MSRKAVVKGDENQSLPTTVVANTNWKHHIVGCGSNSFGQLNPTTEGANYLMVPSFHSFEVPIKSNLKGNAQDPEPDKNIYPKLISCSSNLTATVISDDADLNQKSDQIVLWGSSGGNHFTFSTPIVTRSEIIQISCGQSHIGFVTTTGKVFAWGNGENGMLGHGNKTAVPAPKVIQSLADKQTLFISCGAYHTGIIVREKLSEVQAANNSNSGTGNSKSGRSGVKSTASNNATTAAATSTNSTNTNTEVYVNSLYMCGLGKAGQLGLSDLPKSSIAATPMKVKYFSVAELSVTKVSCGFHHTLVVASPASASVSSPDESTQDSDNNEIKNTIGDAQNKVYSFGWGEHGRLGEF